MFKKILNEARFTFNIEATGPILIKDGETDDEKKKRKDKDRQNSPYMRFVVDSRNNVFLPGSSIKGVWRSWCEKIARTISNDVPLACDPFNINDKDPKNKNISCSKKLEEIKDTPLIYASSCPICKIFGHTSLASRIRISDAYPDKPLNRDNLQIRDGIGIDRFTGGASDGAKFRYQFLTGATFKTNVHIRNFELWQLGLLGYLFRDFKEELVPIGFGKTKGLGKVKGTLGDAELTFYGLNRPKIENNRAQILGTGSMYDDDKNEYGFDKKSSLENIEIVSSSETAIKTILKLSNNKESNYQVDALFNKAADFWACLKNNKQEGYFLAAQQSRNKIMEGA